MNSIWLIFENAKIKKKVGGGGGGGGWVDVNQELK